MCSWLRPGSFFSLISQITPKDIQSDFKSHYCSKHPDFEIDVGSVAPTARS
jgi:hypothetical protein